MEHLSTAGLDTMNDCPTAGMAVKLQCVEDDRIDMNKAFFLNAVGRNDVGALLNAKVMVMVMVTGCHWLGFSVAPYFRRLGVV